MPQLESGIRNPDPGPQTFDRELTAGSRMLGVLKIPRFRAFSISQAISNFGDKIDYMALLAMIRALAVRNQWDISRANSFLLVVGTLPAIIFGPLAGVLVDRWNKRKVMLICDSLRAALVLLVPLLALWTMSLPLVFTVVFFVFLLGMFFNTARLAAIPNLVEGHNILEANSVANLMGRPMTFLGFLLGGLIVDWQVWRHLGIRESWSAGFYVDSLTFVASAVTLAFIRIQFAPKVAGLGSAAAAGGPGSADRSRFGALLHLLGRKTRDVFRDFREAYGLMRKTPAVRLVMFSIIQFVLLGAAVVVLLIPIIQLARDDLGLGVGTRGVGFVGATGAIGLVVSALLYGLLGRRVRKRNVILGGFAILGVIGVLIASSESLLLTLILAFAAGLVLSPILIAQDTLLHETVPEATRGRVFSSREWFMNLSTAVSAIVIGQVLLVFPQWKDVLFRLPFGVALDDRRTLLVIISVVVALLSLFGFAFTRRQQIT